MALSGSAKELKPLLDAIKGNGFKVVPAGKHHKIVDTDGKLGAKNKVVTDDNGPIIISSTPGDFRARDMHVKRLKDRGIITKDPWAPDKGEKKGDRRNALTDPEVQQKKRDAIAAESRRREERTKQLRARLEPIVAKLGGWEKQGLTAEFGRTAFEFLKANNRVEGWASVDGAIQNTRQLRLGNTLSDKAVDAWSVFADELEKAWRRGPGTTPNDEALRTRYFDLVRVAKGLPTEPPPKAANGGGAAVALPHRVPERPREPEPHPDPDEPLVRVGAGANGGGDRFVGRGLLGEKVPRLALEAMWLMAGNASPENKERAMEIAEEILRLEIATL